MAKINFSSALDDSLRGRANTNIAKVPPNTTAEAEKAVDKESKARPIKKEAEPKTTIEAKSIEKKSKAGRKKKQEHEKKQQMVLTISPEVYYKLKDWADKKPRSAPNYVSDYIEEHIDDIIKN